MGFSLDLATLLSDHKCFISLLSIRCVLVYHSCVSVYYYSSRHNRSANSVMFSLGSITAIFVTYLTRIRSSITVTPVEYAGEKQLRLHEHTLTVCYISCVIIYTFYRLFCQSNPLLTERQKKKSQFIGCFVNVKLLFLIHKLAIAAVSTNEDAAHVLSSAGLGPVRSIFIVRSAICV